MKLKTPFMSSYLKNNSTNLYLIFFFFLNLSLLDIRVLVKSFVFIMYLLIFCIYYEYLHSKRQRLEKLDGILSLESNPTSYAALIILIMLGEEQIWFL